VLWDIRLTERHGVLRYPLGATNTVDFICEARKSADEPPTLHIRTDEPFELNVQWNANQHGVRIDMRETTLRLSLATEPRPSEGM
jgi:hypothetical protein